MKYSKLCDYYNRLESTSKNLKLRDIVSELLEEANTDNIELITLASMGRIFPVSVDKDIGIAGKTVQSIIVKTYGVDEDSVVDQYRELGDLGKVAEQFCENRKQQSLMQKELDVQDVYDRLRELPEISGQGSQDRKEGVVKELLMSASPREARYIVKTILDEMRMGVGEGIVRDAIAEAFDVPKDKVENAYFILTNYGEVAKIAMVDGEEGLDNVEIEVGKPIMTMHPTAAESFETAFESYDKVALEVKYDGFRAQIHKDGNDIRIFSRRLEEVTRQFPDVVEWAKECLKPEKCIVDSEILAVGEDGKPLAFQKLSKRIRRKYNIEKMVEEIPVQVNCFDIFYSNGQGYMEHTMEERWKALEKVVDASDKFKLAEHFETADIDKARKFYQKALDKGQEGIIVKNMDANYQPGRRVGYWQKVKETMEPLDLVITEARWGEGRRSDWLSSLLLSARDSETGDLLTVGRLGTGLTEKNLEEVTQRLKDLITSRDGRKVKVKPRIVVEIGYEEIQKSPKYESGYALRFPRLLRFRNDKSVEGIDTFRRIEKLYKEQS